VLLFGVLNNVFLGLGRFVSVVLKQSFVNKRKTATRYIDVATQQPAGRVLLRLSQSDLLGRLLLYDVSNYNNDHSETLRHFIT